MNNQTKKEVLYDLDRVIRTLEAREAKETEDLKVLSDHAIEDVALHKDLDLISVTVLIYSLYKVITGLGKDDYDQVLMQFKFARRALSDGNLGKYNRSIKNLYAIIQRCNVQVREHLQDVMQAARIKKGTVLLEKGLSIGQAAGLMGLSNWDLQQYAAKTVVLGHHRESVSVKKRLQAAFKWFKVG